MHPFGMLVPNRHGSSESYRYGFNGKEKDDEVKGEGLQLDYGFRIYDPRIGKFLSQDPLFKEFANLTPYQFSSNTPIQAVDIDGLEAWVAIWATQSYDSYGRPRVGHTGIIVKNYKEVKKAITEKTLDIGTFVSTGREVFKTSTSIITTYEPTGSYTYYDLWPTTVNYADKKDGIKDKSPRYYQQSFSILNSSGVLIQDDKVLEKWLKEHDVSQIEDIVKGKAEQVEGVNIKVGEAKGSSEGYPQNGLVKLNLTPEQSFNLNKTYNDLLTNNQDYNGITNNCTTFICNGLNTIYGYNKIKPETIIDFYNIALFSITSEAYTPNETFKQLSKESVNQVIIDGKKETKESYEDAIIDY